MKQTAVEKFIKQLEEKGGSWENVSIGRIQISITVEDYLELQKQANEMFKEQIMDAWDVGKDSFSSMSAEQHYNETFKSE